MAFHKMASGHFAYVINESGNRQLVTQEQFEDCCCPAPCACPCEGSWPPAEWPCSELLETYSTSGNISRTISPETVATNFTWSNITVNATSTSCRWEGTGTVTKTVGTGDPEDITTTIRVSLDTTNCRWLLSVSPGVPTSATVAKSVGSSPIGTYNVSVLSSSGSGTIT